MYKLLIVDDEHMERQALRVMVSKMFPNIEVVGEAENGRKAIEMAEQYQPDFITMDIKMPGIDGLQTIEEIKKLSPGATFVIMSAFDSFNYAKKAIKLHVNDYLLKPYKRQELRETFQRICRQKDEEKRERLETLKLKDQLGHINTLAEVEWVSTLIHNQHQDFSLEELNRLLNIQIIEGMCVVIHISSVEGLTLSDSHKKHCYKTIKNLVKKQIECIVGPMINQHIPVFVMNDEEKQSTSLRNKVIHLIKDTFQTMSAQGECKELELFAGAGQPYRSMDGLKKSYHEGIIALRDREYKGKIRFYQDLIGDVKEGTIPVELEKQLLQALYSGNYSNVVQLFDSIFTRMHTHFAGELEQLKKYVTELFIVITRVSELSYVNDLAYYPTVENVEQLREEALFRLKEIMEEVTHESSQNSEDFFRKGKAYISQNYKKDLTLEFVAKEINLSPTYFSKLFKNHAGINFIDYLTQVRIGEAKRLLTTTDMSLKEICFEVGYRDPNYFSRVFKKSESIPPSQYRDQVTIKG
ncbi:two-component system response regulator YesN [Evansella vedderi]|uniref:Two-component system response regulator YesN n=1 Tax=Evansella vedderi TaxID=38282 RepID=A0ABT9ZQA8_9BACI|nr:response regulator [Evansella vedderi]MDQ0253425.1 two-component system response regulator YesN [Evansella vedderi]